MSEGIIIALITAAGSLVGAIAGNFINARATIMAASIKNGRTQSDESSPSRTQWRLGGALLGGIIVLAGLWFLGLLPSSSSVSSNPTPTAVAGTEAIVTRSEIDKWSLGETTVEKVQICLEEAHNRPVPYHSYDKGEIIPSNALIASGFWFDGGVHWNQLPVKPVCINGDWGLFESTGEFQAPGPGSYWRIIP
jgi:hypothetical protein